MLSTTKMYPFGIGKDIGEALLFYLIRNDIANSVYWRPIV
jgi:hypothetical protein